MENLVGIKGNLLTKRNQWTACQTRCYRNSMSTKHLLSTSSRGPNTWFDSDTSKRKMSNLLNIHTRLWRLQFVLSTNGDIFSKTVKFAAIVKQYFYHEQPTDAEKPSDGVAIYSAEARTLRFLESEMLISEKDRFREFHNYTLMCGQPLATVLLSPQAICKNCHKQLSLDPKPHPIVINSLKGTYLGCRLTKFCWTVRTVPTAS